MSDTPQENAPASPAEVEEFSSDSVSVKVERAPFCRVKMTVTPSKAIWEKANKQGVKEIAKEVNIPGYRKGKAPKSIIEKRYGEALKNAREKAAAGIVWEEAQKLARIPLLNGNSQISYHAENTGNGFEGELVFQFETEPKIGEIDPSAFTLPDLPEETIDDKKIENTIRSIQMFYAKWNQIEDRPVKEGDFVVLDIEDLDTDPPSMAFSNSRFEVEKGKMAEWMRDLIIGKKKTEAVEGVSKPDEDASEEVKKEFKPKNVRITVKGIEEADLPPLDDSLAKKVGVDTVDTLRNKLRDLLTKQVKEARQKQLRDHVGKDLLEKIQFDPPASVFEKEANFRINELFRSPQFSEKWKEMSEEEKEAKKEEIKKQAKDAISLFYICRYIVTKNHIELSEEEMTPKYDTILEMMFADPSRLNLQNRTKEQKAIEFSKFMLAKAEDHLISEIEAAKSGKSASNS